MRKHTRKRQAMHALTPAVVYWLPRCRLYANADSAPTHCAVRITRGAMQILPTAAYDGPVIELHVQDGRALPINELGDATHSMALDTGITGDKAAWEAMLYGKPMT